MLHAQTDPTRFVVLWGDEASIYRQPTLADRYSPVGEEPTADLSHKANTRFRLCGGLAAGTGATTYVAGKKIGITKLCQFVTALRERYPELNKLEAAASETPIAESQPERVGHS